MDFLRMIRCMSICLALLFKKIPLQVQFISEKVDLPKLVARKQSRNELLKILVCDLELFC